jgi:hypothetical protein
VCWNTLECVKVPVEEVSEPREVVTVYNFRVADFHTYFVGTPAWKFAIWTHNTNTGPGNRLSRAEWQRRVRDLRDEIAQIQDDIAGIERRGRNHGYGPHRVTGSESYLAQKMRELADLMTQRPAD